MSKTYQFGEFALFSQRQNAENTTWMRECEPFPEALGLALPAPHTTVLSYHAPLCLPGPPVCKKHHANAKSADISAEGRVRKSQCEPPQYQAPTSPWGPHYTPKTWPWQKRSKSQSIRAQRTTRANALNGAENPENDMTNKNISAG